MKALLSFLFYGFLGEQIYNGFMRGVDNQSFITAILPIALLLVITGIAYAIAKAFDKKKRSLAYLVVWLVYLLVVGFGQIMVIFLTLGILNLIRGIFTGELFQSSTSKPRTPEQQKRDRKGALRSVVYQANDLVDYLDDDSRRRYEAEFNRLLWDEKATDEDISRMQTRWSYYYSNPQVGSKRYRELHPDD